MNTLLLIDAYAMIYRAYYAFMRVPRINSQGMNTSAIFGFVLTLEDMLKKTHPTHVAVAFDPKGPTFRHEAFEAYKAQRAETPEDIHRAVPVIKDILNAMRITILEVEGFEADDVIGTIAHKAEKENFRVLMATPDKDYGQLVTSLVHQYRPKHNGGFEELGPEQVCNKYDISSTRQVIDLLGLMGDASDNIPGCKGVGEKTAVKLLNQFGSIENLLEHVDQLQGAIQDKVRSQMDDIRFSMFLATIRLDVPIEFDADKLLIQPRDTEALKAVYTQLEFSSLLKSMNEETPPASKTRKTVQQELSLDLFDSPQQDISTNTTTQSLEEEQKNRLCAYLLNPEMAYNPANPPQWEQLQKNPLLWKLYNEVEWPLVNVLRDMENAGVRLDVQQLKEAEKQLTNELNNIEQQIYHLAAEQLKVDSYQFNINSPAMVGELLFSKLQLDPKAKKSKTGKFSTSEEILLPLVEKCPMVGKILDYRELKKLINTYITALPTYINPNTGKIHTTYNQTTTATGRLSSSNPNLQNLPIRTERGQLIRQAIIPDANCLFMSADYSQIELRLMAHFSQDEHMLQAFINQQDIHAATAAKIFHHPIEEVTKEERRKAKSANFGIIYGISPFGLSQQLGCSRAEAKSLIEDYFIAFPKIIQYIEQQKEFARSHGYAVTLFGRRRYLPDILSHNSVVRSFSERNAVNAPIQGTAADIIKMAMVAIHRQLREEHLATEMIMQVHDELNFNVPLDEVEKVQDIVVHTMQNIVSLSVPLIAECGVGANWLEAH